MSKIITNLITLNNITLCEAINEIVQQSRTKNTGYVVTPNIDHLTRLIDPNQATGLLPVYQSASLNLCDSRVLEKLLKLKGYKVTEVIPGSTLTQKLFDESITEKDTVLVVGGDELVINKLRALYSHLTIKHVNPVMGFINDETEVNKTLNSIKKAQANYVFLAVGSPRQEILAKKIKDQNLVNGVVLCIGASILFIVGEEKRAPMLIQTMHLEWLYRAMQDPKRLLSRYIDNIIRLPKLYKSI
jgi:exopolysaccharide biosynthesis WecB/TagA/CpsF family protein